MGANEASKWRPIYRNVQLDEKCKVNTLGRGERERERAGGGGRQQREAGAAVRGRGAEEGTSERRGEGKGARSLSQAVLPPTHNHVAKSTRGDRADYLRGSTRGGPAPPPALPSGSMWSLAAGDSGSSADAGNNGLIDGGAERLGARVPRPFAPRLPRTAGGPFP